MADRVDVGTAVADEVEGNGPPGDADEPEEADEVEEPVDVEDPETAEAGSPWSKVSPWATVVVALLALAGFAASIIKGWDFVVSKDETAEKADWEQLLGLIDRVDTIVLFILGAVFGVAVQARQTAEAKGAAKKNKKEAERQHAKAKRNHGVAQTNRQVARKKDRLARGNERAARRATREMKEAARKVRALQSDPTRAFVRSEVRPDAPAAATRVRTLLSSARAEGIETLDVRDQEPELEGLAAALEASADEIERGLG